MSVHDVIVVGAGPAGLGLAAACADTGLDVCLLDPEPEAVWPHTYGLWSDEAAAAQLADLLARRWHTTVVRPHAGPPVRLARGYALLDNAAVQNRLHRWLHAAHARVLADAAVGATDGVVTLRGGGTVTGRLVVDASGSAPALARRPHPAAFQTAFGAVLTLDEPPGVRDAMTLMDFRRPPGPPPSSDGQQAAPTFLYCMDLGDRRWFVEETSLVARRPLPFAVLRARLAQRLATPLPDLHDPGVERCVFPFGGAIPEPVEGVVAFGAAASMVHPASGYQVGQTLGRTRALAGTIAEVLATGQGPRQTADRVNAAVWPTDRRRQHALHRLGLAALLDADLTMLQDFFAAFFALPEGRWRDYLSGARQVGHTRRAMREVFAATGSPLRRHLVTTALGPARTDFFEGLGAPFSPPARARQRTQTPRR